MPKKHSRNGITIYNPIVTANGDNARAAGRDIYENCIVIGDEALKGVKGVSRRKLREVRKIFELYAEICKYRYLTELTRAGRSTDNQIIADYERVVGEVVAQECDDFDSYRDRALEELKDSRIEYAEVKRDYATDEESRRTVAFYVLIGIMVACSIALCCIVSLCDIGKTSVIVTLSVISACVIILFVVENFLVDDGWDNVSGWMPYALMLFASTIGLLLFAAYSPQFCTWVDNVWYSITKYPQDQELLNRGNIFVAWFIGISIIAFVIIMIALTIKRAIIEKCCICFHLYSVCIPIALIGLVLSFWISSWFWVMATVGLVIGVIGSIVEYASYDKKAIFMNIASSVGIVVIGFTIASIVEHAFPGFIFGEISKALQNWWSHVIFWK